MTTEGVMLRDGNRVAGADLSAKQFYAVQESTVADRTVLLASAATAISGILQNTPVSGQAADVAFNGVTKAIIGTAGVTRGDALQVEASSGKLITKGAGVQVAVAQESAAADTLARVTLTGPAG